MHLLHSVVAGRILEIKKRCESLLRKRKESKWIDRFYGGAFAVFLLLHTQRIHFGVLNSIPLCLHVHHLLFISRTSTPKLESLQRAMKKVFFFLFFFSITECIKHRKPKLIKEIKQKIKENEKKNHRMKSPYSVCVFSLLLFVFI